MFMIRFCFAFCSETSGLKFSSSSLVRFGKRMRSLCAVIFFCFSVVCVEASELLEVSGHVGGEVSVRCSGSWIAADSSDHNFYFCRGVCSEENSLIQTETKTSAVTQRGRYSMEVSRGDAAFSVTIKRLRRTDAGRYQCAAGTGSSMMLQEVDLIVLNASTVPPGSPPFTTTSTTLQTAAQTFPRGSSSFSTAALSATAPAAEGNTNQPAANKLTGTTVVIIVSVSLALLVCAVIPVIFYGRWHNNRGSQKRPEANKSNADCCEESADVVSGQAAVKLQSLEPDVDSESSVQDASQYSAIYQALDPKSLD